MHCFPQIFPALPALLKQLQSNFNPNLPRSICSGPACDLFMLQGRHPTVMAAICPLLWIRHASQRRCRSHMRRRPGALMRRKMRDYLSASVVTSLVSEHLHCRGEKGSTGSRSRSSLTGRGRSELSETARRSCRRDHKAPGYFFSFAGFFPRLFVLPAGNSEIGHTGFQSCGSL